MSTKIPQSEWDAIVARRRQGESVASIARSYGCSPPLIYRILSRQQEGADASEPAVEAVAMPEVESPLDESAPAPTAQPELALEPVAAPEPQPPAPEPRPLTLAAPPPVERPAIVERAPIVVAPVERTQIIHRATAEESAERPEPLPRPERPAALSASLDGALRAEIEETINAFRSAFDAALSDGGAEARAALRAAASDLMRAGARTTIVLERLAAPSRAHPPFPSRNGGDRPSAPLPVPPRRPAPPPAEPAAQPPAPTLAPGESVRMTGAVKWYNAEKGFGFIAVESGHRDVFVRASALQRSGLASLAEGQQVTLEVTQGRKGPEAVEIRLAE
jgi:cold shock CspA family protein/transposase-like protein